MTTQLVSAQEISPRENVLSKPQSAGRLHLRLIAMLVEWRRRIRSRRELACLSDLELKDIGYPAQVEAEKAKPFWRR